MKRGATVELFSRSTGFDVLHDDAGARLAAAHPDVIVEATGRFTMSRRTAEDFFTRSTRAIASAADSSGARHLLLSIVNCELPEAQGYGYFAGKTAQERVARAESSNLTIVRSTQWFEFARPNVERMKFGPFALVPSMLIQPVALDAVAEVIAECATGARTGRHYEVAGREQLTLLAMTKKLRDTSVTPIPLPIPLPIPGRMGRAFRSGALLPAIDGETVGPGFADWLGTATRAQL